MVSTVEAHPGDESAFAALVERHRRALHIHCYRMLGSFEEAEDAVQETLLRAWRARDSFQGGELLRAWLYRIATNACLDAIRRSRRRPPSASSHNEVSWLQPYPDRLLDEVAPGAEQPDAVVVARETIELAFVAVIQLLPARQRAVLLLRDVLGWSASETAERLDLTVAAANSALQRARATLHQQRPAERLDRRTTDLSERERELLDRFIALHESGDADAAVSLLREDIRVTMPPYPWLYEGIPAVRALMEGGTGASGPGEWRLVPTRANRQPAAASYLREWDDTELRALKLDVLRVEEGKIVEITTFGSGLFPAFGLPPVLPRP
ncbi:MAG: sigma-70 family RNA polymerase sigma factor [Chloroflexi bacterium]|nr:MAG: sigma-70 family RNA polymerase sigma factor [Chloroflexota bacterium]